MKDSSAQLKKANALGDDRNLHDNGKYDRHYWYSIGDGFRLLFSTRRGLKYTNEFEVAYAIKGGEEFSSTRENRQKVFLAEN